MKLTGEMKKYVENKVQKLLNESIKLVELEKQFREERLKLIKESNVFKTLVSDLSPNVSIDNCKVEIDYTSLYLTIYHNGNTLRIYRSFNDNPYVKEYKGKLSFAPWTDNYGIYKCCDINLIKMHNYLGFSGKTAKDLDELANNIYNDTIVECKNQYNIAIYNIKEALK